MDECMGHKVSEKGGHFPSCFLSPHSIRHSDVSSCIHLPPALPIHGRGWAFLNKRTSKAAISWPKLSVSQLRELPTGQHRSRSLTDPAQIMSLLWPCYTTSLSYRVRKITPSHKKVETLNEIMYAECSHMTDNQ